jgi:hypothetical protein
MLRGSETRSGRYRIASGADKCAVTCDSYTGDGNVLLRDQLMRAGVFCEIPNADASRAVAADDLALVRVDGDIIDGAAMAVAALDRAAARLPDLDGAVLRAGNHPFSLAVECDTRDIASVAFEDEKGSRVGGSDIKQFDGVMTGGGEEALVRRYTESVYLRVRVLNRARADAGERLPEPVVECISSSC